MVVVKPTGKGGKPLNPKPIKPKPLNKSEGGMSNKPKKPKIIQLMPQGVFYKGKAKDYPGIKELIKNKNKKSQGGEMLKGGQRKLDKNKDGKISSEDFKLIRREKPEIKPLKAREGKMVKTPDGKKEEDKYSKYVRSIKLPDAKDIRNEVKKKAMGGEMKQGKVQKVFLGKMIKGAGKSIGRLFGRKKTATATPSGEDMGGRIGIFPVGRGPIKALIDEGKVKKASLGLMALKKAKDKGAKGIEFLSPLAMLKRISGKKKGGVAKGGGADMGTEMSDKRKKKFKFIMDRLKSPTTINIREDYESGTKSPMQRDRKREGYRAKVESLGGKVLFADEMSKGGGADTGRMGEIKSIFAVARDKFKRIEPGGRPSEYDIKKMVDLIKKSRDPRQIQKSKSREDKPMQPLQPVKKKMGGGMMQRPMGYKKGTMVMARGCKLGRKKATKLY